MRLLQIMQDLQMRMSNMKMNCLLVGIFMFSLAKGGSSLSQRPSHLYNRQAQRLSWTLSGSDTVQTYFSTNRDFHPLPAKPPQNFSGTKSIVINSGGPSSAADQSNGDTVLGNLVNFYTSLSFWLPVGSALKLPIEVDIAKKNFTKTWCGDTDCSSYEQCEPVYLVIYTCIRQFIQFQFRNRGLENSVIFTQLLAGENSICDLSKQTAESYRCPILVIKSDANNTISVVDDEPDNFNTIPGRTVPNPSAGLTYGTLGLQLNPANPNGFIWGTSFTEYNLTAANWVSTSTDDNLQALIRGGADTDGVFWQPLNSESSGFATRFIDQVANLKVQCDPSVGCDGLSFSCSNVGSRDTPNYGQVIYSRWAFFVLRALQNIAIHFQKQREAISEATLQSALRSFSLEPFYPKPQGGISLSDVLNGFGSALGVVSGFSPIFSTGISLGGTALSQVGKYLEDDLAQAKLDKIAVQAFTATLSEVYNQSLRTVERVAVDLFNGKSIGGVNITDMMKEGSWVDPTAIQSVGDAARQMKIEILSRGINALWKIPHGNKMWVLFVDTNDTEGSTQNCDLNRDGPLDSRYCADGGAYYTYNFVEEDGNGYVFYPWGSDQLASWDLDLKMVTEASARSYRAAKKQQQGQPDFNPFTAFNGSEAIQDYILDAVQANGKIDLRQSAGHYPGSWTLPICEASTWGQNWNVDYNNTAYNPRKATTGLIFTGHVFDKTGPWATHPPCMCGEKGLETAAFAVAAGLDGFRLWYDKCRATLTDKSKFTWPADVTEVDMGNGTKISRP